MNIGDHVTRFWAETLPDWIEIVVDVECGGLFDRIVAGDRAERTDPKTTLVHARTLFTLAHIEMAGHGNIATRAAATSARTFLMDSLGHPDGGWCKAVSRTGALDVKEANPTRDCYDHAFVVLAFATWAQIDPSTIGDLDRAWLAVETLFCQSNGSLMEDDRGLTELPRRQNPHMHMFEACLFAWEATGRIIWRDRAEMLLEVFERHLVDKDTGTIREFLSSDLGALEGQKGAIREPGHHYEWVWLLNRYSRLGGTRQIDASRNALLAFADAHGRASTGPMAGAAFDEVSPQGDVISPTHLLWPQTEAIKAFLSEYERTGDPHRLESARQMLSLIFKFYLGQGTRFWINQRDMKADIIWSDTLSRLLYHIVVALTEGERIGAWGADSSCSEPVPISATDRVKYQIS